MSDAFACAEIGCEHLEGQNLQECEKARCCFGLPAATGGRPHRTGSEGRESEGKDEGSCVSY